jgi:hypothetical protein
MAGILVACSPEVAVPSPLVEACEASDGVGCVEPCLGSNENVAFLYGSEDDAVHPGAELVSGGSWSAQGDVFGVRIHRSDEDGETEAFYFRGSASPERLLLRVGVFGPAVSWQDYDERPGLWIIDYPSRSGICSPRVAGRFQVHELDPPMEVSGWEPQKITISFEQRCGLRGLLRGCVHYEPNEQ